MPHSSPPPSPGRMPRRLVLGGLAAAPAALGSTLSGSAASAAPAASQAAPPRLAMEEFRLPGPEDGVSVYLRNKRPAGTERFAPDRILLYVHGATYPASTAFDLPLAGLSMMDYLAGQGFDVYLVDLPGYGLSGRPAAMGRPAARPPTASPSCARGTPPRWSARRSTSSAGGAGSTGST